MTPPDTDGTLYQRSSDGRWFGAYENGYHPNGKRRRSTVSAATEGEAKRKLRDAIRAKRAGQQVSRNLTVKKWADDYLKIRVRQLAPKAYRAAENPIRLWVVPTIGHRLIGDLTPADIRAVHDACRKKGRDIDDVHRALHTMLTTALAEGHHVAATTLAVKAPKRKGESDREAMSIPEGLACLEVAATLPHGSRWAFTLVYGSRLGETLGLTRDEIDWAAGKHGIARIEWQLQSLPYNEPFNRASGFRIPDDYEARHLVDSFHLVRPKSKKGRRLAPLLPFVRTSLEHWLSIAPDNPWGLVWPNALGRPANDKHDRLEWHALQGTAGVGHPSGRPYHVHECRNFAATMLFRGGVPEHVITDLLGHVSILTSDRYRSEQIDELTDAMEKVERLLQLG